MAAVVNDEVIALSEIYEAGGEYIEGAATADSQRMRDERLSLRCSTSLSHRSRW